MLVLIIVIILLFHAVIFYGLLTRRFNALYVAAAMFAFSAPISAAVMLPHLNLIKQWRVYCTLLIIALALLFFRAFRIGLTSLVVTAFIGFYCLSALWSDQVFDGVLYKGLFGAVFLSGLLLASGTNSKEELRTGIRILSLAGAAFAAFVLLELVRNPGAIAHVGRLMAFGMNPNRIGQESAAMFLLATFLALYDRGGWKVFGYGLAGVIGIVILYTGSRGAAGMAIFGAMVLFLPMVKRPGLFALTTILVAATLYIGVSLIEDRARERLAHVTLETRDRIWTEAIEHFTESPVFGQGWVYNVRPGEGVATRNLHSIYLQVLAETGVVGMMFLMITLLFLAGRSLVAWRFLTRIPDAKGLGYLMVALVIAVFAHGFVESSTFVGATVNAMLLGYAVGLVDRLPRLVRADGLSDLDECQLNQRSAAFADVEAMVDYQR